MEMSAIPFGTTDWAKVERTGHAGETGMACWRTRRFVLMPGVSYQVADGAEPHRSSAATGATLFIVD